MQYTEGYILDDRYLLKSLIGSGSFGEVWVAEDRQTDIEVAVKIYISMDQQGLADFKKEFQVSFGLNHTNLLHANYLGTEAQGNRVYLVMPLCPNGSVSKFIGNMDENSIWKFIKDVSSGLAYLHSLNPPIIHQDIKPDNILISKDGDYLITDFGISKQLRSTLKKSAHHLNSAGAVSYMGPERFSKQYQAVKASDIWSLGATIFELATGDLPFCGMGGGMLNNGAEIPSLPEEFSPVLEMVMASCLAKETWERPTAKQLEEMANGILAGENPAPTWNCPSAMKLLERNVIDKEQSESDSSASIPEATVPLTQYNKGNIGKNTLPVGEAENISKEYPAFSQVSQKLEKNNSAMMFIAAGVCGLITGILLNLFI
jgi:serine/threonine protein kinase